ncbi:MAG TPA: hypothetical protein VMH61_05415 [Candidatus Acidoferrales bacterium]|nr:hypothetical protein [Candidatus Acidoferrales bacterium]
MTWRSAVLACALGGLILVPLPSRAQDLARARVQDALDQTDRRIEVATSLVTESASAGPSARSELSAARDLEARAQSAFQASQFRIAIVQTLDARDHADRAIALVRGLPDPDRVEVQVERTRDVLDRARDALDACANTRARALLKVALDVQQRAEAAVQESRYLAALQLTRTAHERVQRAMRLCNLDESIADMSQRALQRTDDVLARAQDRIERDAGGSAAADLARAGTIQSQAQAEYHAGHFESALRLTQNARVIALRMLRPLRTSQAR